jgi:chromosome segregation ATPase
MADLKIINPAMIEHLAVLTEQGVVFTTPFSTNLTTDQVSSMLGSIYTQESITAFLDKYPSPSSTRNVIVAFLMGIDVRGEVNGVVQLLASVYPEIMQKVIESLDVKPISDAFNPVIKDITDKIDGVNTSINALNEGTLKTISDASDELTGDLKTAQTAISDSQTAVAKSQTAIEESQKALEKSQGSLETTQGTLSTQIETLSGVVTEAKALQTSIGSDAATLKAAVETMTSTIRDLSVSISGLNDAINGVSGIRQSLSSLSAATVQNYSSWVEYAKTVANDKVTVSEGSKTLAEITDQITVFVGTVPQITEAFASAATLSNIASSIASKLEEQTNKWTSGYNFMKEAVNDCGDKISDMREVVNVLDGSVTRAITSSENQTAQMHDMFMRQNETVAKFCNTLADIISSKLVANLNSFVVKKIEEKPGTIEYLEAIKDASEALVNTKTLLKQEKPTL